MNASHPAFDLNLAHRAMFRVPDAADVKIVCHTGSLWITLDDDPRDIVLLASESFTTPDHRRALVYAMEPSNISVAAAPVATASRRNDARRPLVLEHVFA